MALAGGALWGLCFSVQPWLPLCAIGLVPLLLLPLVIPMMIAATGASAPLFDAGGPSYDKFGPWLMVMGLYDAIFCLVGYAVFEFLLED